MLPFEHCGIKKETIIKDETGITYFLKDKRRVFCPTRGGVWLGCTQVSGTCDRPYESVELNLKTYLGKKQR
jgi:hypothetical protein